MLSAVFVDRPRLAIVIAIVTTIAGLLALYALPLAQYPDIVPPQVSVTTTYPGANSAVVESTVAQVIEAQVVGVDKMIYMKSTSGDDGSYALTASFELGTDPDINTVNVNNRVQVALATLPETVQRQGVTVKKKSSALLGVIAVYSPKRTHDPLFLSNYVTINLLDQIKSTPGVGDATLWGPQDYAMRAWVRTDRLTGLGLTTGDIINAIQAQNVQAAVGRIGARPISNDQQLQLNLETKGRLDTIGDFENIVIRTNPDGSVLRLGDVARVELGAANLDRDTRFNGGPAAAIALYQTPGANALKTLKAVKDLIAEAEKRFPEDLAWKVTYDPTLFVTETIHEVQKTLFEAFILVVIVVFLFLGSVRATLIPTFAVPVSLIGAFVALLAVGYSGNTVSLLAVVLAIGIVVDDAIVVVENVERVMEEHPELTPGEATKQAMSEITAPIVAIVGFRAGSVYSRHIRRTVPAVRGDSRRRHVALSDQCADIIASVVRHPAAAASRPAPRRHGLCDAQHRSRARCLWVGGSSPRAVLGDWHCDGRGCDGWNCWPCKTDADRIPAGGRPRRAVCRHSVARRLFRGANDRCCPANRVNFAG
jgi:hydrophobe/amphiphile efflux-1 (HAE1) family protein